MSTTNAPAKNSPPAEERSWQEKVVARLKDDGTEFALNSELVPIARIKEGGFQTEWEIDSQRFMDFLIATCIFNEETKVWKPFEMQVLLALLREDCRRGGRSLTEVEAKKVEADPIVQTLLSLMETHEDYFNLTAKLLDKLKEIECLRGSFSSKAITCFVSAFGSQLRRLAPALAGLGIEVTFSHRETGSHVRLRRLENFSFLGGVSAKPDDADGGFGMSSEWSSVVNSVLGRSLAPADGTDGETRIDGDVESTSAIDVEGGAA